MPLLIEEARYFWLRSLEGQASVERAVGKWNKGFPDTPVTLDGVNEFLGEMKRLKDIGFKDCDAMEKIIGSMLPTPQVVVEKKPIVTEIKEFKAPVVEKKKRTWRKKKAEKK